MDLLIVPVPLFNNDIAVEAYYFRNRKGNNLLEGTGTSQLDGAMVSPPLEMLNMVSMEALTMGKPIFVPITRYMLLGNLEQQSHQPADKIIFLIDGGDIDKPEIYTDNIVRLQKLGYRFGIQKIDDAERLLPILQYCEYVFFDNRILDRMQEVKMRVAVGPRHKNIVSVYTHIDNMDLFGELMDAGCSGMFEGRFYRTPMTRGGSHDVSPLQVNLINLLNMVRDEHFEFEDVSSVIQKDPALTISLLRLVNSAYFALKEKVKTINQAVVMLGQTEIRKWITTAVAKLLGAEKPSEVTRLSLIRAKFAEGLANKFGIASESQSLFLMGLFSVLDAILERPIDQALELVHVSDDIYEALVRNGGPYSLIYQFILEYEAANWSLISRMLILHDLTADDVYQSYVDAIIWYSDLLGDE
jgi:EAL and modified HD-GYP domain-containing signal transduction protein